MKISIFVLASFLICFADESNTGKNIQVDSTSINVNNQVYGARPNENGPIGGGSGYKQIINKGNYNVKDLGGLIDALENVKTGEIIFIDGNTEIDCTNIIFTEKFQIKLPEGVTLASNRGYKGSEGANIKSDNISTSPLINVLGPNVRITGLRIIGPDPKPRLEHHKRSLDCTPVVRQIGLEQPDRVFGF